MSINTRKVGTTAYPLETYIYFGPKQLIVDLSLASFVKIWMWEENTPSEFKIEGATCTIVDAPTATNPDAQKVRYEWQSADVDTPGNYMILLLAQWPDSTKAYAPSVGVIRMMIEQNPVEPPPGP